MNFSLHRCFHGLAALGLAWLGAGGWVQAAPLPGAQAALAINLAAIAGNVATGDAGSAAPAPASSHVPLPNLVDITPQLTTSGQPTAEGLSSLAAKGYEAVIYLAPPNVGDAVRDEHLIVGSQGLIFVNIPIRFGNPTEKDFETFAATLSALGKRKVLVHCQVNMRASSMTFLYRTIKLKEDPAKAWESVTKIWVPEGPWKQLISSQLKKNDIRFEPF